MRYLLIFIFVFLTNVWGGFFNNPSTTTTHSYLSFSGVAISGRPYSGSSIYAYCSSSSVVSYKPYIFLDNSTGFFDYFLSHDLTYTIDSSNYYNSFFPDGSHALTSSYFLLNGSYWESFSVSNCESFLSSATFDSFSSSQLDSLISLLDSFFTFPPSLLCPTLYSSPSDPSYVPEQYCDVSYLNQVSSSQFFASSALWHDEDFMGTTGCCVIDTDDCGSGFIYDFSTSSCVPDSSVYCYTCDSLFDAVELKCFQDNGVVGLSSFNCVENDGCADWASLSYTCNTSLDVIENPVDSNGSLSNDFLADNESLVSDLSPDDSIPFVKDDSPYVAPDLSNNDVSADSSVSSGTVERDSLAAALDANSYLGNIDKTLDGVNKSTNYISDFLSSGNDFPDSDNMAKSVESNIESYLDKALEHFEVPLLSDVVYSPLPYFDFPLVIPQYGIDISLFSSEHFSSAFNTPIPMMDEMSVIDLLRIIVYYSAVMSAVLIAIFKI